MTALTTEHRRYSGGPQTSSTTFSPFDELLSRVIFSVYLFFSFNMISNENVHSHFNQNQVHLCSTCLQDRLIVSSGNISPSITGHASLWSYIISISGSGSMYEKQYGKQATLNSLKVLKSRTRDINFCEDLSMMAEEFSQHRFDGSFCSI